MSHTYNKPRLARKNYALFAGISIALLAPVVHIFHASQYNRSTALLISLLTALTTLWLTRDKRHWQNRRTPLVVGLLFIYPLTNIAFTLEELGYLHSLMPACTLEIVCAGLALTYAKHQIDEYEYRLNLVGLAADLRLIYIGLCLPVLLIFNQPIAQLVTQHQWLAVEVLVGLIGYLSALPLTVGFLCYRPADRRSHLSDLCISIFISSYFLFRLVALTLPVGHADVEFYERIAVTALNMAGGCTLCIAFHHHSSYRDTQRRAPLNNLLLLGTTLTLLMPSLAAMVARYGFDVGIDAYMLFITSVFGASVVITRIIVLLREEKKLRNHLHTETRIDPLTGLCNRGNFLENLSQMPIGSVSVGYIDVDDFKAINDLCGHQGGDDVLKQLSAILSQESMHTLSGRMGGDEFVVAFIGDERRALAAGRLLQKRLCGWQQAAGHSVYVSVTLAMSGVAHDSPNSMLRAADLAMYRAKRERLGFIHESQLQACAHDDRQLRRQQIYTALSNSSIPIYLQPIYSASGHLSGYEALARLHDANGQIMSPDKFLDIVVKDGLELELTRAVINSLATLPSELKGITIGVNIPPRLLTHATSARELINWLQAAGRSPDDTVLEITEQEMESDILLDALQELSASGYLIALDDFGSGYTSYSRVANTPVNILKLDRSLVEIASSGSTAALESAIELARRIQATVVAEGVSSPAQLRTVMHYGCDRIQGYLLGRPMPAIDAARVPKFIALEALYPAFTPKLHAPIKRANL